jgi:hypothetical protein
MIDPADRESLIRDALELVKRALRPGLAAADGRLEALESRMFALESRPARAPTGTLDESDRALLLTVRESLDELIGRVG